MRKMIIAGLLLGLMVGLFALVTPARPAEANRYNDPATDLADYFWLDLEAYEPERDIEAVTVIIDTDGDDPRYYELDVERGEFILTNPLPEESRENY